MSESVDELTCERRDDEDLLVTKQLQKVVLTKGAWATILFLYQDLNRATGEFGKSKVRIQRYQKRAGVYRPHTRFNISSLAQAQQICDVIMQWIKQDQQ